MNLGIKNKNALVTGASRGIGKAIALGLAKEGAHVAVVSRTKLDLDKLVEEMGGIQKGHYAISKDLTIDHTPEVVMKEITCEFGYPDILINNLGGTLDVKDPDCSIYDWRKVWRLNLEVAIELNNLVIPHMKKIGWGRIVNISSVSSKENQGPIPYCTMKAALNAYTRSMGRILSQQGIIMNAVAPGAIYTKGGYWDKVDSKYAKKYVDEKMAIKRFGKPEEISSVVSFLCSEQASFCVGSLFLADGGQGKFFN